MLWQIKELEDKLREQEQQLQHRLSHEFTDFVKATPTEAKSTNSIRDDEPINEPELRILRSSNSVNRPMSHGSILPKGNEVVRKKRESRSGEAENIIMTNLTSTSLYDNKKRKSDPPRFARGLTRATKTVTATTQGAVTHKRINRDHGLGIKERDAKKKIWSR